MTERNALLGSLAAKRGALFALILLLVACGGGNTGFQGDEESETGQFNPTVTMNLISFKPEELTIQVETTVTWEQPTLPYTR